MKWIHFSSIVSVCKGFVRELSQFCSQAYSTTKAPRDDSCYLIQHVGSSLRSDLLIHTKVWCIMTCLSYTHTGSKLNCRALFLFFKNVFQAHPPPPWDMPVDKVSL